MRRKFLLPTSHHELGNRLQTITNSRFSREAVFFPGKQGRDLHLVDSWRVIRELSRKPLDKSLMDRGYAKRDVLDPFQGHTFG